MAQLVKFSAAFYIIAGVISFGGLAGPGWRIPFFAVMCASGALLVLADKHSVRLSAIPMVLVASALVTWDWYAGLRHFEEMTAWREHVRSMAPASAPQNTSGAYSGILWRDFNKDGVFDQLLVNVDHSDLLRLDRGVYIFVDAVWTRAEPAQAGKLRADSREYSFDSALGTWVPD